jgi:hypothetical protein
MVKKKMSKIKKIARKILPFGEAKKFHSTRSNRSKSMDERKKNKNIIRDFRWKKSPGKFDYPGIDTPNKNSKKKTPSKKLSQKEKWMNKAKKRREWAEINFKKARDLKKQDRNSMKGIEPGQPVHSRKDRNKRERSIQRNFKILELEKKAKGHLAKAKNLEKMAKTNKGDAQNRRQSRYEILKKKWKVGDTVNHAVYNKKVKILKFNKKSIRIHHDEWGDYSVDPALLESIGK